MTIDWSGDTNGRFCTSSALIKNLSALDLEGSHGILDISLIIQTSEKLQAAYYNTEAVWQHGKTIKTGVKFKLKISNKRNFNVPTTVERKGHWYLHHKENIDHFTESRGTVRKMEGGTLENAELQ